MSHNRNPVLKLPTQNHASRIKKAAATISGWDCPLLTFIYPGFHCGSGCHHTNQTVKQATKHASNQTGNKAAKQPSNKALPARDTHGIVQARLAKLHPKRRCRCHRGATANASRTNPLLLAGSCREEGGKKRSQSCTRKVLKKLASLVAPGPG